MAELVRMEACNFNACFYRFLPCAIYRSAVGVLVIAFIFCLAAAEQICFQRFAGLKQ